MATVTFKVEIKDGAIDDMVAAVKKAAKAKGIDFEGDNKSGKGKKMGAEISYVVKDNTVTVTCEDSFLSRAADWDAKRLADKVREWIKPFEK